jgi:hypothetical protein
MHGLNLLDAIENEKCRQPALLALLEILTISRCWLYFQDYVVGHHLEECGYDKTMLTQTGIPFVSFSFSFWMYIVVTTESNYLKITHAEF